MAGICLVYSMGKEGVDKYCNGHNGTTAQRPFLQPDQPRRIGRSCPAHQLSCTNQVQLWAYFRVWAEVSTAVNPVVLRSSWLEAAQLAVPASKGDTRKYMFRLPGKRKNTGRALPFRPGDTRKYGLWLSNYEQLIGLIVPRSWPPPH